MTAGAPPTLTETVPSTGDSFEKVTTTVSVSGPGPSLGTSKLIVPDVGMKLPSATGLITRLSMVMRKLVCSVSVSASVAELIVMVPSSSPKRTFIVPETDPVFVTRSIEPASVRKSSPELNFRSNVPSTARSAIVKSV